MNWTLWTIWLVGAYFVGSIPFGLLLARFKGVDIRSHGSGNIGATNVGRVLGRKLGILCFLLDVLKGMTPVLSYGLIAGVSRALGHPTDDAETTTAPTTLALAWLAMALAAVLGHVFPVWLKFKGGKGVATSLGVLLGFYPYLTFPAALGFVVWVATVKLSGYVGLASVIAAAVLPLLAAAVGYTWGLSLGPGIAFTAVTALLAAVVIVRHIGNLKRIAAGTEPKVAWAGHKG